MNVIESVLSFFGFIPEVIIFIMCISYMTKRKASDATLLFAGSFTILASQVFFVSIPLLTLLTNWPTEDLLDFIRIGRAVSVIGSGLFCVGFVLLIKKVLPFTSNAKVNS